VPGGSVLKMALKSLSTCNQDDAHGCFSAKAKSQHMSAWQQRAEDGIEVAIHLQRNISR
jgi:hypothetical protein